MEAFGSRTVSKRELEQRELEDRGLEHDIIILLTNNKSAYEIIATLFQIMLTFFFLCMYFIRTNWSKRSLDYQYIVYPFPLIMIGCIMLLIIRVTDIMYKNINISCLSALMIVDVELYMTRSIISYKDRLMLSLMAVTDSIITNDFIGMVCVVAGLIVHTELSYLINTIENLMLLPFTLFVNNFGKLLKRLNKQSTTKPFYVLTNVKEFEIAESCSDNSRHIFYTVNCYNPPYIFDKGKITSQIVLNVSQVHYNPIAQQNSPAIATHAYVSTQLIQFPNAKQTAQINHNKMDNSNTASSHSIYRMVSKPCGMAIIINNEIFDMQFKPRSGSDMDAKNLRILFNYLGFDTYCHNNKTHMEMKHILNDVAAMDHDKYDCLMVAILTHGDYGDVLYGTTGGRIVIQEVTETFSSKRCPTLTGKPKIFIIQACRGRRQNEVVWLKATNDDECDSGPTVYPDKLDYLVAHSTIPGHVSYRNIHNGSIFISTLVKIFRRYAAYEDINTMLVRVTNEVTKYEPRQDRRQCPELHSTLTQLVYFNISKCKCD